MEPGTRIREYEMVRMLGRGGMAEVWLTSSPRMKGQYAAKFILDQFAGNTEIQTRFVEEALKQSGLHHSNIVDVKTVFEDKGRDYIIMEYVESSLDKRLHELYGKPLPLSEAVSITLQLLDALSYTHTLPGGPLIHRDIKPSNILLKADGSIRLTDFGIALAANEARKTMTGQALGTLFYMSPEQIRTPGAVDSRTDIYSAGCVVYEMLTGRPPFGKDGDTDYIIQHHHINRMPDPLRRSNASIPEQFEWVVLRSLAKDAKVRFQTCREMATALLTVYREAGLPLEELTPYPSWLSRSTPPPTVVQPVVLPDQRPTGGTVIQPPPGPRTGPRIVNPLPPSIGPATTPRDAPLPAKTDRSKGMAMGAVVLLVALTTIGGVLYSSHKGELPAQQKASPYQLNENTAQSSGASPTRVTAVPSISPSTRAFNSPLDVKLSDATPGAQIYYTTDGGQPTTNSHPYGGAIKLLPPTGRSKGPAEPDSWTVDKQLTIRAIAVAEGYQPSPEIETTFVLKLRSDPAPTDPNGLADWCYHHPGNTKSCKDSIPRGAMYPQGSHP